MHATFYIWHNQYERMNAAERRVDVPIMVPPDKARRHLPLQRSDHTRSHFLIVFEWVMRIVQSDDVVELLTDGGKLVRMLANVKALLANAVERQLRHLFRTYRPPPCPYRESPSRQLRTMRRPFDLEVCRAIADTDWRGIMASIGIVKGQPFKPDAHTRAILDAAAKTAFKMSRSMIFDELAQHPGSSAPFRSSTCLSERITFTSAGDRDTPSHGFF